MRFSQYIEGVIHQTLLYSSIILVFLLLSACANQRFAPKPMPMTETWGGVVATDPQIWLYQADKWFKKGEPNDTELNNLHAPLSDEISTTVVKVPGFTRVDVCGAFQAQVVVVDHERNGVYIIGPHEAARNISIHVIGNTLQVLQTQFVPLAEMSRVIVRIGVKDLEDLTNRGPGPLEAIHLRPRPLMITSLGNGNTWIGGSVNLQRVVLLGHGTVYVFGVDTNSLSLFASGSGDINLAGHVGVNQIVNHGVGSIHVIGALTDSLAIFANNSGRVTLFGNIGACDIKTYQRAGVYIRGVNSNRLRVIANDASEVGISGVVGELAVFANQQSCFLGSHLCARTLTVRTNNVAHANVNASDHVFARAGGRSAIYFFGPPNLIAGFSSGSGMILPLGRQTACNIDSEYRDYSYTLAPGPGPLLPRRHYKDE